MNQPTDKLRQRAPAPRNLNGLAGILAIVVVTSTVTVFVHDHFWPHVDTTGHDHAEPGAPAEATRDTRRSREPRLAGEWPGGPGGVAAQAAETDPAGLHTKPDDTSKSRGIDDPVLAHRVPDELTPMGAERTGNADGTIPSWDGGIRSPTEAGFSDFVSGGHHPDPFPADPVLVRIDATNAQRFDALLSDGHRRLLADFPTYFLNIYATRRSAAYPPVVYDAMRRNRQAASLGGDGATVSGASIGSPFPVPVSGIEAVWNHLLRYRGTTARFVTASVVTGQNDPRIRTVSSYRYLSPYVDRSVSPEPGEPFAAIWLERVVAPDTLAGNAALYRESLDLVARESDVFAYSAARHRVRHAPNLAFDAPRTGSAGAHFVDEFDMFSGSPLSFAWRLIGKRELFVPYNAYRLHSGELTEAAITGPLHLDQALARYERHRVWVVEGARRNGVAHRVAMRRFYLDEDSWQILLAESYDDGGRLVRFAEGHVINYYDVPLVWTTLEVLHDLAARVYVVSGLDNERPTTYVFSNGVMPADVSVAALGRRHD